MRKPSQVRLTLASLSVATVLSFAAPAFAEGKVSVATSIDPGSWDPIDTFLVAWGAVASNIFDGLTSRGVDAKVGPCLAVSWNLLDEGSRIRFHLREDVKFHNGEPFNAAAVKFTFDRLLGEEGAKGHSSLTIRPLII